MLRSGPATLPESMPLMMSVIAYDVFISASNLMAKLPINTAVAFTGANLLILYVLVRITLQLNQVSHRLTQTVSALIGADAILATLQRFFSVLPSEVSGEPSAWLQATWALWIFWWLAIQGNIIKHAIDTSRINAALLSIWFLLVTGFLLLPFAKVLQPGIS